MGITAESLSRYKENTDKTNVASTPMSLIPSGTFNMGSDGWRTNPPDEFPLHTVWLNAFYIDKYEVTTAQYLDFAKASGKKLPPTYLGHFHPISGISWHDATAYCKWVGKRLPTEAEWEKAASPQNLHPPKYSSLVRERIRYEKAPYGTTRPIGETLPNQYGIYDMYGNVWEWCADWYDENYYAHSPARNPKGPPAGNSRVLRGGASCYGLGVQVSRPTARLWAEPEETGGYGFRCAKDFDTVKKTNEKTK